MVVDDTILFTDDLPYHLGFDQAVEPPVICQVGGNQDDQAAKVTRVVRNHGYTEINLNAGCPSHRVASKRCFGAALLQDIPKAIAMLRGMQEGIQEDGDDAKISIKLRIGVDDDDDWIWTRHVVAQLAPVCKRFYVHARKVHTQGLDPAQNRRIPPLDYPRVYALCREFPDCDFWVNGGILTLAHAKQVCFGVESKESLAANNEPDEESEHYFGLIPPGHGRLPCRICQQPNGSCITPPLVNAVPSNLRGCMVGRGMMDDPIGFATLDCDFFGDTQNPSQNRRQVLERYAGYLAKLYPRRCGDVWNDKSRRDTVRPPGIVPLQDYYCPHCQCGIQARPPEEQPSAGDDSSSSSPPVLIHRHVIGRALKPVQGIFCGIPGMVKPWRRLLQQAMSDKACLNCGPGFLLQRAVQRLREGGDERVSAHLDRTFGQGDENRSGNAP